MRFPLIGKIDPLSKGIRPILDQFFTEELETHRIEGRFRTFAFHQLSTFGSSGSTPLSTGKPGPMPADSGAA